MTEDKPDIVARLRAAASFAASDERRALLLDAAEAIETLRALVGIRREIELEDAEPEGHG
jgi:hypothetical protein